MIVSFHQQFLLKVGEKVRLAGTLGKAEHPVPEVAATHTADAQGPELDYFLGRKIEDRVAGRSSRQRLDVVLS